MNVPLLEINGLSRVFSEKKGAFGKKVQLRAVNGINLSLGAGETLGLAGESGCGKSTLARVAMGLIPPSSGTIRFNGIDISTMRGEQLNFFRKNVQMIFQDPFSSLNPRMRVGEIVAEPLEIHRLVPRVDIKQKVSLLLQRVGLSEEHSFRFPHEFSGGQRQRIGIARALAVSPQLIIADEPVSALDLSIQAQILNLLMELKKELSLSFLFIAHDLSVVRHMSDRIAIMYLGKIVEIAKRDSIFEGYLHPYTEALLSAIPQIDPAVKRKHVILTGDVPSPLSLPSGCPFHTRCPYATKPLCFEMPPPLEEKEPTHFAACHFSERLFR